MLRTKIRDKSFKTRDIFKTTRASEADDGAEFLGVACAATDLVILNDFNEINVNGGRNQSGKRMLCYRRFGGYCCQR